MESLAARKPRLALRVEPLEDRRLLSQFAPASAWDAMPRPIDTSVETGPMFGGSSGTRTASLTEPGAGRSQAERSDFVGTAEPQNGPSDHTDTAEPPTLSTVVCPTSSVTNGSTSSPPAGSTTESQTASNPLDSTESVAERGSPASTFNPNSYEPAPASSTTSVGHAVESIASVASPLPPVVPVRLSSNVSISRSSSEVLPTAARVDVSAGEASSPGRSNSDSTLLAIASTTSSLSEVTSSPDQARGVVAINLGGAPGALAGQVVSGQTPPPSRELSEVANPPGAPIIVEGDGFAPETLAEAGRSAGALPAPALEIDAPQPALADVIQSFLPIDRSAMEAAIDRFFEPFDGLASTMPEIRGPMGLITASLAAAATVVALEVAIRIRRARENDLGADDFDGATSFPGI